MQWFINIYEAVMKLKIKNNQGCHLSSNINDAFSKGAWLTRRHNKIILSYFCLSVCAVLLNLSSCALLISSDQKEEKSVSVVVSLLNCEYKHCLKVKSK